ncbi:MAG: ABC transporter permease subunit [Pyrinomonadaceae bacterium]|nr:ABC transporter permease subunit [Pyrinomonadaceae bacterium]
MLRFIIRRLLVILPMVLLVITIAYALIKLAPGNFYATERGLPEAVERNIRQKYGLDKSWYVQYGKTMWNIMRGDFGFSRKYQDQTVNEILWQAAPVSATLGLTAYLLALTLGLTFGTLAALRQNSALDYGSMAAAMLGISLPNFVLGPLLVLVFALTLFWLPPARWEWWVKIGSGGIPNPRFLLMPAVTLAALYTAYIARLTRSGMLEVLRKDYIRTARAKGLSERQVVIRHALRGGILPVVSFTGPALAFIVAGTVVVERVFAIPGLGNYFINAALNRDAPLLLGITAFVAILVLVFNLLVDIAYAFIDPRIRY